MADKLKPCPFCGSKDENPYDHTPECYLRQLWSLIEDVSEPSREELLKAWNIRAERTCRMTQYGPESVLEGWWRCSECEGPVYPPCNEEIAVWALQRCPRCGAKVVE